MGECGGDPESWVSRSCGATHSALVSLSIFVYQLVDLTFSFVVLSCTSAAVIA